MSIRRRPDAVVKVAVPKRVREAKVDSSAETVGASQKAAAGSIVDEFVPHRPGDAPAVVLATRLCDPATGAPPSPERIADKMLEILRRWASSGPRTESGAMLGAVAARDHEAYFGILYAPDTGLLRVVELAQGDHEKVALDTKKLAALIPPGEVFLGGFHNHPSGAATPSPEDATAAASVDKALQQRQPKMSLRHFIVAGGSRGVDVQELKASGSATDVAEFHGVRMAKPKPLGLRAAGSRPVTGRTVAELGQADAVKALVAGMTPQRAQAMAIGSLAVLFGLEPNMLRPSLRADVEKLLATYPSRNLALDSDAIFAHVQEVWRTAGATELPKEAQASMLAAAREAAFSRSKIPAKDLTNDWGLRGFRLDADFFDGSHVLELLSLTVPGAGRPDAARQAFDKAWQALAPADVLPPILFTDTGSGANAALVSVATAVARHRSENPAASGIAAGTEKTNEKVAQGRLLFFDGVYGGGFGFASGMGLGPWSNATKPNLEKDRVVSPTAPEWPITSPERLADVLAMEKEALAQLEEQFKKGGQETVGGLLLEPIQSFNNVSFYRPEFLLAVRDLADRYAVPIIADEIFTGGGRTGAFFGYQHYRDENGRAFQPDFVCFGKMVQAAGIAPVKRDTEQLGWLSKLDGRALFGPDGEQFDAPAVLKGARVLEAIASEGLVENAAATGEAFRERLKAAGGKDVHGLGLLIGLSENSASLSLTPSDTTSSENLHEKLRSGSADLGVRFSRLIPEMTLTVDGLDALFAPAEGWKAQPAFPDIADGLGLTTPQAVALLWSDQAQLRDGLTPDAQQKLDELAQRAKNADKSTLAAAVTLASGVGIEWPAELKGSGPSSNVADMLDGALAALVQTLSTASVATAPPDLRSPTVSQDPRDPMHEDVTHVRDVVLESGGRASNYHHLQSPSKATLDVTTYWSEIVPKLGLSFVTDHRSSAFEIVGSIANEAVRQRLGQSWTTDLGAKKNGAVLSFSNVLAADFGVGSGTGGVKRNAGAVAAPGDVVDAPVFRGEQPPVGEALVRLEAAEQAALAKIAERLADIVDAPVGALLIDPLALHRGIERFRPEFLLEVQKLCMNAKVPVIVDESATSGGVTGRFFAYESYELPGVGCPLVPDHVLFGGALGAFGMASTGRRDLRTGGGFGLSTVTVEAHRAIAIRQSLKAIHERDLVKHAHEMEPVLSDKLGRLQEQLGVARDVRVTGQTAVLTLPAELAAKSRGEILEQDGARATVRLQFPLTFDEAALTSWLYQLGG